MKFFGTNIYLIVVCITFLSCQRELNFGESSGVLKKAANRNCFPITINGTYKADTVLNSNNFIDVEVDVAFPRTFHIGSDTVNGYFFHQSGNVDRGTSTIRLYATGKPITAGVNNFIIKYGTSSCNVNIKVLGLQPAVYTLAGAPNLCTGIYVDGTYTINTALTASNIITVQANVTQAGYYSLTAATTNGFSFSGNGIFTSTGLQNIVLKGTGIPIRAEVSNVIVNNIVSTCNLGVTVLSDTAGKATFTFDGSPNACINFTINGTYYAGIATDLNNSVTMSINVTKPGTYNINTNNADGISFSSTGSFINTGPQTVTLSATGTPILSGPTAFVPNTGTVSCDFNLNILPLPPPAAFILSGAPNACTPVTVNGFYILSKPLDAANNVVIQVNVTNPGSYTISTNTVDGISFSVSGVFTASGLQNITLHGHGTPQAIGIFTLTPNYSTSSCSFNVHVT